MKKTVRLFLLVFIIMLGLCGCNGGFSITDINDGINSNIDIGDNLIDNDDNNNNDDTIDNEIVDNNSDITDVIEELDLEACDTDETYQVVNNNEPYFTDDELATESFESYSELDDLGRCGTAVACVGEDIMPTEKRGSIGRVKPSGWQTVKYAGLVDGGYLYNRCHLIGYQLTGENANEENLITGTRYMNVDGMLPFENMVADYVKETNNHVMYRVTPVFKEDNLVADGVLMEAKSVEDDGEGILFNVFCYNIQPGVNIDYEDGTSEIDDDYVPD